MATWMLYVAQKMAFVIVAMSYSEEASPPASVILQFCN